MIRTILGASGVLFLLLLLNLGGIPASVVIGMGVLLFICGMVFYLINMYRGAAKAVARKKSYTLHRFVIKPGHITSIYDGETHWISAAQLIRLYDLKHGEYIIHKPGYKYQNSDILLMPVYNGQYEENKQQLLDKFYELQFV